MPTYAYSCTQCHQTHEVLQKITAEPLKDCPSCHGKGTLMRGFGGGIGVSFSGSGFYATDYSSSPPPKECCPCGKKQKCGEDATSS